MTRETDSKPASPANRRRGYAKLGGLIDARTALGCENDGVCVDIYSALHVHTRPKRRNNTETSGDAFFYICVFEGGPFFFEVKRRDESL